MNGGISIQSIAESGFVMRNFSVAVVVSASIACAFLGWLLIRLDVDTLVIPPDAVLPDGSVYYGDVLDGRFHGRGRLIWPNGGRYEGGFFQGLISGEGEFRFASGNVYKGEFREGRMSGTGRLDMGGGRVYTGAFLNDMPNGRGVLVEEDGSRYEGEFVNWKFQGEGTYTGPDGEVYEGDFIGGEFTGTGVHRDADGNVYEGEFLNWQFHGPGVYKAAEGGTYSGKFEHGMLNGKGRYENTSGERYEGEFKDWLYDGQGVLITGQGDRYTGGFEQGYFHGKGERVLAPAPDKSADEAARTQTGEWQHGQFQDPEAATREARLRRSVEQALYRQDALLQKAWQTLLPGAGTGEGDTIDLYFVGVAGDGGQDVFLKEVNYVRELFDRDFGTRGRSVVLVNNPETLDDMPLATRVSLERTLQAVAGKMDVERDILFLYLTSHGSEDHKFFIDQRGIALPDLPAPELAAMLDALPIKWRVIMISACYSGGFIPYLKNARTLIMTAASGERTSFGCSDTSEMTYFGKAFFKEALPKAASFEDAFETAKNRIYEWETTEFKSEAEHSDPQIAAGAEISTYLKAWWPRKAVAVQEDRKEKEEESP